MGGLLVTLVSCSESPAWIGTLASASDCIDTVAWMTLDGFAAANEELSKSLPKASRLTPKLIGGFQSEAPGIPHRAKRGKEFAAMRPVIVSIPSVLKMLRDPIRPWQGPSLGMCVEEYAESFHAIGPLEHGAIPLLFSPTHLLARYPSPVDKIGRVEIEPATDFLCHAAFLFLGVGERSGLRHDAKS
jgi:hypothetical protein